MRQAKTRHIVIEQPLECCPTCEHAHPGGVGAEWCGCYDCALLFGRVERQWMGEEAGKRYDELRTQMAAAGGLR